MWFSDNEQSQFNGLVGVLEEHFEAIVDRVRHKLRAHPQLRQALTPPKPDDRATGQSSLWHCLRAGQNGTWNDFEELLRSCGQDSALAGAVIDDWCGFGVLVEDELVPLLVRACEADAARLTAALHILHRFVAQSTTTIANSMSAQQERKLEGLRKAEDAGAKFARLSESGLLGVLVCDFAGNIRDANEGFLDKFGYSREELLSGDVRWADMTPPEWQSLDESAIAELRESGKTRPWEKEYFHKDGSRIPILVGVAALNEAETIAFVLDNTERKRLEELSAKSAELVMENRQIQEANRLKSEFLANMSHELRTPLNSIIGFAELLHDKEVDPSSEQHHEFLGDILLSGRHLLQLINDVLDLAKVEAGKIELCPEHIDLARQIQEVSAVLRTVAAAKNISIEITVDPAVREATIDPARFKQILYNYLSNALKFTDDGGSIKVSLQPEAHHMFRLIVHDTGVGIETSDLSRLFMDFQQLDAGATKKHAGTGLGLALTKRLVELLGGSVSVKSVYGKGSEFHALLPLNSAMAAEPPETPESIARPDAATILVVEDDVQDQKLLRRTLSQAGYGVSMAGTGKQALASCEKHTFDAITLDLLLPDMTGLQVLHNMRLNGRNRHTPVFVVSVVAEKGVVGGFSVQDYLTKPVDSSELLRSLEHASVPPRKDASILVVDDEVASFRLVGATLKPLGYRLAHRKNGAEALAFTEQQRPLAVVLDLLMPVSDGFQFLQAFRERPENRDIPVIVWTMKDLTLEDKGQLHQLAQAVFLKGDGKPASLMAELQRLISNPHPRIGMAESP